VTLVEALTQQLPTACGPRQEPLLPETLPAEFLPMARACLRAEPRRRASLYNILTQFDRVGPGLVEEVSQEPPASPRKWLSLTLVAASALLFAVILAAPRLLPRPPASVQAVQPVVAPVSKPAGNIPESVQAAESASPAPDVAAAPALPVSSPRAPKNEGVAVAGQVLHQVLPGVSPQVRKTIRGRVKIQIRAAVDAGGRVTSAQVESENSRYFANLSLQAARQWGFAPEATGHWLLRFEFTPAGDTVQPSRVGP
jgi:hypothetical protein